MIKKSTNKQKIKDIKEVNGIDKDFILQEPLLKEAPGGSFRAAAANVFPLTAGGSDRIFYRIREVDRSVILLCDNNKENFLSFIQIGQFFNENSIPVPRIYGYDFFHQKALLEDLGDETLFQKIRYSNNSDLFQEYYQKVIDVLVALQGISPEQTSGCTALQKRFFDYKQRRWETSYFAQYFLREYCKILIKDEEELEEGFHHLAASFAHEPFFLMHRDFQSQNIIRKIDEPYLLDFQGARFGIAAYDLASLLHDCYIVLEDDLRELLISYYLNQRQERLGIYQKREEFNSLYLRSALQRNMQALGAFSFLTLVKKKKQFEPFIPIGIRYLKLNLPHYSPLAVLEKKIRNLPLV